MEGSAWWRGSQLIVIRYLFLVIGKGEKRRPPCEIDVANCDQFTRREMKGELELRGERACGGFARWRRG